MSLESFTHAYIVAALWSSSDQSTDQGGEPLDSNYTADDLAADSLATITQECAEFYNAHSHLFSQCHYKGCPGDEYAGHDFWLTRCGHGCGFWDGDWPEPAASILDKASESAGNRDIYVGDDGMLHYCHG
jgi:hypothetical protein